MRKEQLIIRGNIRQAGEATYGQAGRARKVQGGHDERQLVTETPSYPWRATALLEISGPDGLPYIGTGWFLGPRLLATAGHCVYFQGQGNIGPVQSISVKPGGSNSPFSNVTAKLVSAHPDWENGANPAADFG